MKWRGYGVKDATWEPMEALEERCEDLILDFCEANSGHPAVKHLNLRRSGTNTPEDTREVSTPDLPVEKNTLPVSPPYEEVSKWPVAAKFERGQWFYEKRARRNNGRISSRWFPSIAFSESELKSPELGALRSKYLLALDPKEAALVAAVYALSAPW